MEKTAHPTYAHCPIRHIVDRFGDKWSLLVLYNLHTSGCLRFSEIHRRTADISQKMLTSTLRTGRAAVAQGLPRGAAPRGICAHAPRRVAHAPPHSAYRMGGGEFRRYPRRPGTGKDIATARARPANQADTRGQPPVVSRRQNVVSRQQNKDAPTTSNGKRPSAEPGAPQARQREPIAPPEMRPQRHRLAATRSASGTYPSTKKVPSGTFPILPFHRHTLRAVRCRTPGRNP